MKRILTLLVTVAGATATMADDVHSPRHPWLVTRAAAVTVSGPGSLEVTAQCGAGEVLLGGGYRLTRPALGQAGYLSVEASYPRGGGRWSVVAFNPDTSFSGPNRGSSVVAEAYCLTTPIAAVQVIPSAPVTYALGSDPYPGGTIPVTCPNGSVLTGGGFRTTRTKPDAGYYNAWVSRFQPLAQADAPALSVGWQLVSSIIVWTAPPPGPTTTAYALCASGVPDRMVVKGARQISLPGRFQGGTRVTAGSASTGVLPALDGYGYTYYEGRISCPAGQVAVGGGYEFLGVSPDAVLVPHHVYHNAARSDFSGWTVGGIHGHQAGATGGIRGYAACLRLPPVALTVEIVSPGDHTAAPLGPARPGGLPDRTDLVTFQAMAGDASGHLVTSASFHWTVDGAPLGAGESLTTTLPASPCRVDKRRIEVTATTKAGHTARDVITLFVGGVC